MKKTELVEPKRAAIEAQVHTQQVYLAIANKLMAVQRRGGRVYIVRGSFELWRRNLERRRCMRSAEREERRAVAASAEAS